MNEQLAQQQAPVCPRHPDREAYVRCQRCGRPTCPECQRPAAVGVQCVDCVREQAHTVRQARTVFGGSAATAGSGLVTRTLVGVSVLVYIGQLLRPQLTNEFAFGPVVGWHEPWRALTAAFLHSPQMPLHIVFNMFVLWQIGPYIESLVGRLRFLVMYLVSAVGGSVMVVLLASPPAATDPAQAALTQHASWFTGVVGASGAVFGMFAAYIVLNRHLRRSSTGMYATIAINAVFGFLYPGISWQAHLGGLVTGAACSAAITALATPGRRRWHLPAMFLVLVVLVLAGVVRYLGVPTAYR